MGAFDAFLGGFSGAALGRVLVEVGLNTTAMERGLATTQANLQTQGQKMGGAFKTAITAGATIAAAAVVKFGADAVRAFQESQAVIAQTEAVLRSTGGVAGVTAAQVDKLATSLQQASLFTDEEVASAENLLLTFTSIGQDIFPQTTQAVLDMSAALNQDLKTSALQLGKALQDPIAGLTALRRAGVNVSALTDQVKALVEAGDLLGAQKLILAEVNKEFAGSAQAAEDAAGPFADIADAMDQLEESAGKAIVDALKPLLPILTGLLKVIVPLIPAIELLVVGFVSMKVASLAAAALTALSTVLAEMPGLLGLTALKAQEMGLAMSEAAGPIGLAAAALFLLAQGERAAIDPLDEVGQNVVDLAEAAKLAEEAGISFADALVLVRGAANDATSAFGRLTSHVDRAGQQIQNFAGLTNDELKDWRKDTVENFGTVGDVLSGLGDKAHLTASKVINAFERQIKAQRDYLKDLATLEKRGREVPDAVLTALSELGLDGAAAIDVLAGASKRDFRTIIDAAKQTQDQAERVPRSFEKLGASMDSTGGHVDTLNTKLDGLKVRLDQLDGRVVSFDVVGHVLTP